MQFIEGGPDIPERLLQAHEDGRVVFFCGAGISRPAGLPEFVDLVKRLYSGLAIDPSPVQKAAIKAGQFDTAVGLLEAEIVGGRQIVRNKLARILTPDLTASNATATHEALLTLGKCREGRTRLITTNFDRLFEGVIETKLLPVKCFKAPLLPVPKNRWDGLVYLHGLLTAAPTPSDLDSLVVSSGDFGLAYLTERWAARFVSELFRNYTVCFVGYSINDPVLRYMMDALAADRLLGESPAEIFAFGSHSKGKETDRTNEWRAKNVTPILYREYRRHAYLHRSLRAWAKTYRDGVSGKEYIVSEYAMARPLACTKQDDFVGRLLWALSDPSGLPARRFTNLDPVPSLDWLKPLSEDRLHQSDLARFGVPSKAAVNDSFVFSLTRRPSPYDLAPYMAFADVGARGSRWDEVMSHLAAWLVRHLDDPVLLLWLVKRGAQLHEELARLIERRMDKLAELESGGDTTKLERIRANAPSAIPRPLMRTLWRLLLTGRVKTWVHDPDLYRWCERFRRDGLTTTLRLELREKLIPRVSLREPFRWPSDDDDQDEPERVKDLVDWEIELPAKYIHTNLGNLPKDERWTTALPNLLPDFSGLLRDALDLMRELGGAEDRSDLSYIHWPSISEHPQNRDSDDWTALIELTRDAWLAMAVQSPERARLAANDWWQIPYPLFRRLAFFAAAQTTEIIPNRQGLNWLLADQGWWLWSVETEREAIRLLIALAPQLDEAELVELEQAILAGPPHDMFRDDIEPERWTRIRDREVWLRLAKFAQTDTNLNAAGNERLAELSAQYPEWQLAEDEHDEFPFRIVDGDKLHKFVATPRLRRELIKWLEVPSDIGNWQEDDWLQRCRDNFATTACALCELARKGIWPTDRWQDALHVWSEEKLGKRSWRYMASVISDMPEEILQTLTHGVSSWLQSIAETFEGQDEQFFALCNRVLTLDYESDADADADADDIVARAINHPVGHITKALLSWWYRSSLEDGQRLPNELKLKFTKLCDTRVDKFRHGRVLLTAHVIALFRVDRDWATQYVLPLFDWENSEIEGQSAWEGFLWSPRLYRPLMVVLKPSFLDTARHYDELGKYGRQYASLLTFVALDRGDVFTNAELRASTRTLPEQGLHDAARALARSLEGAGEQRADYWKNRATPYLRDIWPKTQDKASASIAESLGRVCVAAQQAFPEALELLRPLLQPLPRPDYLVHLLHEGEFCMKFPEPALEFLHLVIGHETQGLPRDLRACLDVLRAAEPALGDDLRYSGLMMYLRKHGGDSN